MGRWGKGSQKERDPGGGYVHTSFPLTHTNPPEEGGKEEKEKEEETLVKKEEEDQVFNNEANFLEFQGFCTNCAMTTCVCMLVTLEVKLVALRKEKEDWQPRKEEVEKIKKRKREEDKGETIETEFDIKRAGEERGDNTHTPFPPSKISEDVPICTLPLNPKNGPRDPKIKGLTTKNKPEKPSSPNIKKSRQEPTSFQPPNPKPILGGILNQGPEMGTKPDKKNRNRTS